MEKIVGFWDDETIDAKIKSKTLKEIKNRKNHLEVVFPIKLTLFEFGAIIEALMYFRNNFLDSISDEIVRQVSQVKGDNLLVPVAVYAPYMMSKMDRESKLENWKRIWEIPEEELYGDADEN